MPSITVRGTSKSAPAEIPIDKGDAARAHVREQAELAEPVGPADPQVIQMRGMPEPQSQREEMRMPVINDAASEASEEGEDDGPGEPEPQVESGVSRRELIIKIHNYMNSRLARLLPPMPPAEALEQMSADQLSALLKEMQYTVNVRMNARNIEGIAEWGLRAVESLAARFTPLRLSGLADNCMRDEGFLDTVAEIGLLYQDLAYVPPEKRAVLTILRIGLTTHQMNSYLEQSAGAGQQVKPVKVSGKVSEELAKKYDDL